MADTKTIIRVRVLPRTSKNQVVGMDGGIFKVKLTAPPVEGKANKALRCATKSCKIAQHQKATYEKAQSALLRAQLQKELGKPDADTEVKTALAELARFRGMIESANQSLKGNSQDVSSGCN